MKRRTSRLEFGVYGVRLRQVRLLVTYIWNNGEINEVFLTLCGGGWCEEVTVCENEASQYVSEFSSFTCSVM